MTNASTCVYQPTNEPRCWRSAEVLGYCRRHVGYSEHERKVQEILTSKIREAKSAMDLVGEEILERSVVHGDGQVPEDLAREYRNLWYRHNYLVNVNLQRRPGDELPVEVSMKP